MINYVEKAKCFEFFDMGIELISAQDFCELTGYSKKTIYDWKYRTGKYKTPENLFVVLRNRLHLRVDILKIWIASKNPSLCDGERR